MDLLRRSIALVCLLLVWVPVARAAAAAGPMASEYDVKAALLFKFGKFIEWPAGAFASPSAPLEVCVVAADGLADALTRTVQGRTISERPVNVRRPAAADLRSCHIVFIGAVQPTVLARTFEQLRGAPVLLVGETARFAETGGIVNFVIAANKVRFEVNPEAAERRGLRVSSKLLSLALLVRDAVEGTS